MLPLDHDDFGLNQSKIINVIYLLELERVAGGKPLRTFPQPALVKSLSAALAASGEQRMTAWTTKSQFEKEDLLACARGDMFGPGNAQLPNPPMLMFDRITEITGQGGAYGKGFMRAELDINPDLWFFQCHFLGDPVMPGCLGLDAMWQLVGFFLAWSGGPGRGLERPTSRGRSRPAATWRPTPGTPASPDRR